MTKNTSIALGKAHEKFIEKQIKKGRFASASEVMRAGLRLLEDEELRVEALRNALVEGEKSGAATPFSMDQFLESRLR